MKDNIKTKLKDFSKQWQNRGYEKGETQPFWLELLGILLARDATDFIRFEEQVHLDNTSFMDGYIDETHVLIEQKSLGKSLSAPIKQSDGTMLTPFQQAKRYAAELPYSKRPRWIVTCNFAELYVYDMENPNAEAQVVKLKDIETEYYRLSFLTDTESEHLKKELKISKDAGDLVGKLYDAFLEQYKAVREPTEEDYKSLNILCVRLVFCFYAEDAELFGHRSAFRDFVESYDTNHLRTALIELFKVLDTPENKRDPFLDDSLAAFPYCNGGLFSNEKLVIPQINEKIRSLIIESSAFDWNGISPTIFGACFESTLNPETRRSGGMHYTSIENIHKVIDPLFLNDLNQELDEILSEKIEKKRIQMLDEYQDKLASLKFLDPACGSGNFLTETYLCLRRLENKVIAEKQNNQITMGAVMNPIKVSIQQFYGIEINDFAVSVAMTALWIAEAQMMEKTREIVHQNLEFLPLETFTNIQKGNALRMDWEDVISTKELNYIMGNPPFVGYTNQTIKQKEDVSLFFEAKNIDYVACWYFKAMNTIKDTNICCAFVSTSSITQGEQVDAIWTVLLKKGINIIFAHRSFVWDSEASIKAHVHCVIIGFCAYDNKSKKYIYDNMQPKKVDKISPYLVDTDDIIIKRNSKPISDVEPLGIGNMPIDDGNYLFTEEERDAFIEQEPLSAQYFKKWLDGRGFINGVERYCLWLGDCDPQLLLKMPHCLQLIEKVRDFRLKSKRKATYSIADTPTRFATENMPRDNYIAIPEVSSQRRRYIPMGFLNPSVLCSNKLRIMNNATLYDFGILESNIHMAWMRAVCGRLKSDYDYSIKVVYNNFPWPNPSQEQKKEICITAKGILDARALYPKSSLAALYDVRTMPKELFKAHQANDRAVWEAYGKAWDIKSESDCVAYLMEEYKRLTGGDK